jgi:hypothetical protein
MPSINLISHLFVELQKRYAFVCIKNPQILIKCARAYKIKEVKYFDKLKSHGSATSILLPRAQRTTAGFIKFFFEKVLDPIHIRPERARFGMSRYDY